MGRTVDPGQIRRSTLQDKLTERGYSTRQMRIYAETGGRAVRRFQKRHRNQLWSSDIKFGPYLPIGKDGAKKQVYLVTFSDDPPRGDARGVLSHAGSGHRRGLFPPGHRKFGAPDAAFFDNGKQYRTKWMSRACSKMGIRLLFARPYRPGIERKN